jgi:cobalt-zinc-cadmium efflux system membrane fusion protein
MEYAARQRLKMGWGQRSVVVLLLTVVLVPPLAGFYSYFSGVPLHLLAAKKEDEKEDAAVVAQASVKPVSGKSHSVELSDRVANTLGVRKGHKDSIATAQSPTKMRPMVLPGSTSIIPGRLARIKARFAPARVVEIAQRQDRSPETGMTGYRELRSGDHVSKDEILGVFYSVDVGSKKNDLLEALVQLELDQEIMDQVQKNRYAVPNVYYLTQMRALQGDRTEVSRALNNLKLWDIPQEEIDAIHAEAIKIHSEKEVWFKTPEGRWVRGENLGADRGASDLAKRPGGTAAGANKPASNRTNGAGRPANNHALEPAFDKEDPWGRVTLRAPFDGVIIEQNVHTGEMVVDNTVNLFQLADVSQLLVAVNCPEDDLPALDSLRGRERRWTVHTAGAPALGLHGTMDEISYMIDPNQHTAIVKGYVTNPGLHIRGTQYATATLNIPPPNDVVEIPVKALVDDGRQSLVFVQLDPAKHVFTMRRVEVTHRFADSVFVRKTPIPKEEQLTTNEADEGLLPREPLLPGERVLTAGSVELKRVVTDFDSRPAAKPSDLIAKAKTPPVSDVPSPPEQKSKARKG